MNQKDKDALVGNDLLRLLRLAHMLSIACETIEGDDTIPPFVADQSERLRTQVGKLLRAIQSRVPKAGKVLAEIIEGDDTQDRLELFDTMSGVHNIAEFTIVIQEMINEAKKAA